MVVGVTYTEFWHGDPEIVRFSIEAHTAKQKQDAIQRDSDAWNLGRYVMLGTGVIMSQAFGKSSSAKYPNEPLLGPELDERLAKQKRDREVIKAHADFLAKMNSMSKKLPQ